MKIHLEHNRKKYCIDLSKPIDLSIAFQHHNGVRAFGVDSPEFSPVRAAGFVGSVQEGSPVNFYDLTLNPHGNGTHTECLGHISAKDYSILRQLREYHFIAKLITVTPKLVENGDRIIDRIMIEKSFPNEESLEALIIRTLPNSEDKLVKEYTNTNPPYFTAEAMEYLVEKNVQHLLVDLPSVDREVDEGKVACHHIFWQSKSDAPRENATITEFIYVPEFVGDGLYFLNIMIAPIELDASPSKPILYKLNSNE